jgi:hypothetical protein
MYEIEIAVFVDGDQMWITFPKMYETELEAQTMLGRIYGLESAYPLPSRLKPRP